VVWGAGGFRDTDALPAWRAAVDEEARSRGVA